MKVEVVYNSGQTKLRVHFSRYCPYFTERKAIVRFKNSGTGKPSGKFTLTHDDAQRLARALLLACSAGDVNLVEFSASGKRQGAKAAQERDTKTDCRTPGPAFPSL